MFFQKRLFKSSLLLIGYSAAFKYVPQLAATTFAYSSVAILFFCGVRSGGALQHFPRLLLI